MGYDNLDAWRNLVRRQIPNIAKQSKIDMKNLRWYAAFHDKETNPHVHIVVYSADEREGFLSNHGIEKIRSGFVNDIYADELHHLYQQQTDIRNLLKKQSQELMETLAQNISQNNFQDAELLKLISKLNKQLKTSKGKKVYGYLKADTKKTVDEIFYRLARNKTINQMYSLWCEMEQQKHDVYSSAKVKFSELQDNNEFKSVKNMIIQQVMNMNFLVPEINADRLPDVDYDLDIAPPDDDELLVESLIPTNHIENKENNKYHIKWSDSYKEAHKLIYSKESKSDDYKKAEKLLLSESNNVLALYDLGKLYSMEKSGLKDDEKSFKFYEKALQGFMQIEPTAKKIKPYLQYQIGMMYFKELGTQVDNQKAVEYFEKSAGLGNQYAKRLLAFEYISGENFEKNIEKGISLLTELADSGDAFACYKLGKLYLTEEKYNIEKAISYFEKSVNKNMWASYQLGRLYLFGIQGVEKNKGKAVRWLNLSAEQGNEYSRNLLENTEQYESEMLADTVLGLFANLSRIISDDYNQKFQSGRISVDRKLRRMIQEKKQALGQQEEHIQFY